MEQNNHTTRMAFVLALMLVALVVLSIDQFRDTGNEQQAAVLRAYAR